MTPAITACKYDIAAAAFEYSEERAQSVGPVTKSVMKILCCGTGDSTANTTSFPPVNTNNFHQTFIQENRWKMYISGIGRTLLITALPFFRYVPRFWCVYLLMPQRQSDLNIISRAVMRIQGTDGGTADGFLLYYILARAHIAGLWVAVLLYALTFGCAMFRNVDKLSRL